jgi:hypothetical protein
MVILLVALVVVCALGFVVQLSRSFWASARSADRHRQALDTLAGITQHEALTPTPAPDHDHQAHVRLLGPAGEASLSRALPPPKALSPSQHATSSPLRRPSRYAQGRAHPYAQMPPPMAPANQEAEDEPTRVIPQLILPPPPPSAPTRTQPVAHAHVFHFDDISPLSSSPAAPQPVGAPSNKAAFDRPEPQGTDSERRVAAHALVAAAVALIVAGGAVYVALASHKNSAGLASGPGAATASPARGPSSSTTQSAATTTTASATLSTPSTSTTTQPTASTHPRPVELISSVGGTDTYQLTSRTASIVVTARGPCWVEVRAGSPAGQVVTEETLEAGQQAKVTGPAWIRLGDPPNASVTVDGTPTTVPGAQSGVPLNLDFTVS